MKAKIEAPVGLCLDVTQILAQFTLVLFLSGTPGARGQRRIWAGWAAGFPPKKEQLEDVKVKLFAFV